jgi:hypothetical protein
MVTVGSSKKREEVSVKEEKEECLGCLDALELEDR